jgi:acetylcholinesterase
MKTLHILMILVLFKTSWCCRSSVDTDREPIVSHHAEPGQHEDGEIEIAPNKWEFPVAQTKQGMLWGSIEESRSNKRILAFRGIKHVQPPIGLLRWKPPKPSPSWQGIREAKLNGHVCPQHMYYKPDIWIGQEDCLWLNVFTRDLVVKKKRPVIVWIHGGNFVRGSAAEYEPDYLLDEDIILVTIQYRLGMFGFLSTEDVSAAGNYGMLDQVRELLLL